MTTMLQTLDETAAAYTLPTRAVAPDGGRCRYFIADKCCAVGRCLENPRKFRNVHCSVGSLDTDFDLESILKPEYHGFPIVFWSALQNLHDADLNWDADGLSEGGRRTVNEIKKRFKL